MAKVLQLHLTDGLLKKLEEMSDFEGESLEEMALLAIRWQYADFLKQKAMMEAETNSNKGPQPDDDMPL